MNYTKMHAMLSSWRQNMTPILFLFFFFFRGRGNMFYSFDFHFVCCFFIEFGGSRVMSIRYSLKWLTISVMTWQGIVYSLLDRKDEAKEQFEIYQSLVPEEFPQRQFLDDVVLAAKTESRQQLEKEFKAEFS